MIHSYQLHPFERAGVAWRAVWPTLVASLLFLSFAISKDAVFPEEFFENPQPLPEDQIEAIRLRVLPPSFGWIDFGIFVGIPIFLSIKTTGVMIRRLTRTDDDKIDWLAISLISANVGFMKLYLYALSSSMFPYWFATHVEWIGNILIALRVLLVVSLVWSTALLILAAGKDTVRWRWVHERLGPALVAASLWVLARVTLDGVWQIYAFVAIVSVGLLSLLLSFKLSGQSLFVDDDDDPEFVIQERINQAVISGYDAGQEYERRDIAEQIERGRADGHDAGRIAERSLMNGDIENSRAEGVLEGIAEERARDKAGDSE